MSSYLFLQVRDPGLQELWIRLEEGEETGYRLEAGGELNHQKSRPVAIC